MPQLLSDAADQGEIQRVIGGLAGALPPAIGWAAAAGETPLNALLMVLIIFLVMEPRGLAYRWEILKIAWKIRPYSH